MSEQKVKNGLEKEIEIPDGIKVRFEDNVLILNGPLGESRKDFSKVKTQMMLDGTKVVIKAFRKKKFDLSIVNTAHSLVNNMIKGVTKGFTYKLKIVFAHFPITIKVKGDMVSIENFLGERSPRLTRIIGNCKVSVEGDDVIVTGVSLEDVSQTAANIEKVTKIKEKDQRVFLDGIYVFEKQKG